MIENQREKRLRDALRWSEMRKQGLSARTIAERERISDSALRARYAKALQENPDAGLHPMRSCQSHGPQKALAIWRAYQNGATWPEAGSQFGMKALNAKNLAGYHRKKNPKLFGKHRKRLRKVQEGDPKAWLQQIRNGSTIQEVARQAGISRYTASQILNREHPEELKAAHQEQKDLLNKRNLEEVSRWERDRKRGMTLKAIAKRDSTSYSTMISKIHRARHGEFDPRKPSDAEGK